MGHPEIWEYLTLALWSLNERAAGRPGVDLEPFNMTAVHEDAIDIALLENPELGRPNPQHRAPVPEPDILPSSLSMS